MEQLGGGSSPERVVELVLHHLLLLFRIFGLELFDFLVFELQLLLEGALFLLRRLLCPLHVVCEGLALLLELRYPARKLGLPISCLASGRLFLHLVLQISDQDILLRYVLVFRCDHFVLFD